MKKILLTILMFSICVLCGCNKTFQNPLLTHHLNKLRKSNDTQITKEYYEKISTGIKEGNCNDILNLFAEKVSAQEDLEDDLNNLLKLMENQILNISYDGSKTVSEHSYYGEKEQTITFFFEIEAKTDNYELFVILQSIDTTDEANVGLHSLQLLSTKDENAKFKSKEKGILFINVG